MRVLHDVLDVRASPHAALLVVLLRPVLAAPERAFTTMLAVLPGLVLPWLAVTAPAFPRRRAPAGPRPGCRSGNLPRTALSSGDQREDAAAAAEAIAGKALPSAELVILTGMSRALRGMASGSVSGQAAPRQVRAPVAASLGAAMQRNTAVLDLLPCGAQQSVRLAVRTGTAVTANAAFAQAAAAMTAASAALLAEGIASQFAAGPAPRAQPDGAAAATARRRSAGHRHPRCGHDRFHRRHRTEMGDLSAYAQMAEGEAASRMHLNAQVAEMTTAGTDLIIITKSYEMGRGLRRA